jgi:hypothetical protein
MASSEEFVAAPCEASMREATLEELVQEAGSEELMLQPTSESLVLSTIRSSLVAVLHGFYDKSIPEKIRYLNKRISG